MARLLCLAGVLLTCLAMAAPAAAAPQSNDNFANAQALGADSAGAFGFNTEATKEAGEPQHAGDPGGSSLWYSWTPPFGGGLFRFDTCNGDFDTLLAVYTGTAVNMLTEVASNDDGAHCAPGSQLVFQATGGTNYKIAVDGWSDNGTEPAATGQIGLQIAQEFVPVNDSFVAAEALPSLSFLEVTGDNFLAGKEAGEPNHAGDLGGASVWYRWTAPTSGRMLVDACWFDSIVGVYTGNSVSSLTKVASDFCLVEFQAVAGTQYRIVVDGFSDGGADPPAQDFFLLYLEMLPPSAPPTNNFTIPQVTKPSDKKAPQSKIKDVDVNSEQHEATIKFGSSEAGSKFRCKLDGKPYRSCKSPKTYRNLDEGKHKVKVQARDAAGNLDSSPAVRRFRIEP